MRAPNRWWPPGQCQIAVVVTTHKAALLPQILDALDSQAGMEGRRWQVVVVDNGSRENLAGRLRPSDFRFRLATFEQAHTGTGWARNQGWRRAEAPIVLFLDDDLVPDRRLLAEHLDAHERHPGSVVLGKISLAGPASMRPWTEYDRTKLAAKHVALGQRERPSGIHMGGNFSVSVERLKEAGGFDHRLPGRDHVDLGFRFKRMGVPFVYRPGALAYLHSDPSFESWRIALELQGKLDVAIFRDRGYSGGLSGMVACFHDRHPLNRIAVRLALSTRVMEHGMVGAARRLGAVTLRVGLRRASVASMSMVANVLYWRGVRDGLRGNARFWALVRETRRFPGRTYELVAT